MAAEISDDLATANRGRAVEVTIEPGLSAHGDRGLVHVVLVNLLGNAWKYTARRANAHIEVGRSQGHEAAFFVRDNGAGFDMAYAGRLFAPFQRLHRPEEFEGSGVGLATAQRIVHRHGGRIWARGALGDGATFFFTLPSPGNE